MAIYQFCFGLDKEIFFPSHIFEWEWEILKNVEIPLSLGFRCNFLFHGIIRYSDNFACAITGEYVEMVKAGIIDPFKVIRTALVDAARWSLPSFGKSLCVPVPQLNYLPFEFQCFFAIDNNWGDCFGESTVEKTTQSNAKYGWYGLLDRAVSSVLLELPQFWGLVHSLKDMEEWVKNYE